MTRKGLTLISIGAALIALALLIAHAIWGTTIYKWIVIFNYPAFVLWDLLLKPLFFTKQLSPTAEANATFQVLYVVTSAVEWPVAAKLASLAIAKIHRRSQPPLTT